MTFQTSRARLSSSQVHVQNETNTRVPVFSPGRDILSFTGGNAGIGKETVKVRLSLELVPVPGSTEK